jgi:hypothetical protein
MTSYPEIIKFIIDLYRRFVQSKPNRNSEHRDNILKGLHQIEDYIQTSDNQLDQIVSKADEIKEALTLWFANTHSSSRDQFENIVFLRLKEQVSDLKNIDFKQSSEALKTKVTILMYSCHFLGFRHTSIDPMPGKLVLPLHESPDDSPSKRSEGHPPLLSYLALIFLPAFIFLLYNARGTIFNYFLTHRFSIGPTGIRIVREVPVDLIGECPAGDKVLAQYDDMKDRIIGSSDDDSFKPIKKYVSSLISSGSDTDVNDKSSLSANDLLNIIQQIKKFSPSKAAYLDQLDRFIPLINILKNNEAITKNRQVYQIAVAVPFFSDQSDGPLPFGLGVLRGVDQAQKELLRNTNQKVLLKAIVVNDSIDHSSGSTHTPQLLAHYLAIKGYGGTQFIGLLGHQQTQITKLAANCYKTYGMPVLLTNIQNQESNEYVKTLLPSITDISKEVVNLLEDREKVNKDTKGSAQPDIIVFYDKNDSSSKLFTESLCGRINDRLGASCKLFDISGENLDQKLIKDKKIGNKQWFLAFNPFFGKKLNHVDKNELITTNMEAAITIVDEYGKKRPTQEIYVGHEFVDESLKRRMNSRLDGKNISIWRFSPWDWRADKRKQKEQTPLSGRKCLNWYAVNSLNSMLLFKHLIENSVSDVPNDQQPNITKLRKEISDRLNNHAQDLNGTEPVDFSIKPEKSSLVVTPSKIYRVRLTPQFKKSKTFMNGFSQGHCE